MRRREVIALCPAARNTHGSDRVCVGVRPGRRPLRQRIARPGGNITGFTNLEAVVAGKWLELPQGGRSEHQARRSPVQPGRCDGRWHVLPPSHRGCGVVLRCERRRDRGSHDWRDRARPRSACTHARRRPRRHARSFRRRTPRADDGPRGGPPAACGLRLPQHGGGKELDRTVGRLASEAPWSFRRACRPPVWSSSRWHSAFPLQRLCVHLPRSAASCRIKRITRLLFRRAATFVHKIFARREAC